MIARPYLRTPKTVIIQTTSLARRKRHEFVRAVAQGLIPPETPPLQRKSRKRRYLDVNILCDTRKILMKHYCVIFQTELSQTSTWLRDCEWPEYDSDTEENEVTFKSFLQTSPSSKDHQCGLRCSRHDCASKFPNFPVFCKVATIIVQSLALIITWSWLLHWKCHASR